MFKFLLFIILSIKSFFITYWNDCQTCYAYQRGGILGPYIGQLGKAIVGFVSNGRKLVRTYAKPTKPPSVAQLAQQAKFLICEKFAAKELINLVQPYWNHIKSNISGFNSFMSKNLKRVLTDIDFINILSTTGSYPGIIFTGIQGYDPTSGDVDISWETAVPVNASADDEVVIAIYVIDEWDPDNGVDILKSYFNATKKRSDGNLLQLTLLETGLVVTDIFIYVGVRNPITESKILTGDSIVTNPVVI